MASENDAGEELAIRLRRLRFRAWHRGTREMDLILGPYADARLPEMTAEELDRFEALMEENDPELLAWITGVETPRADADHALIASLLAFRSDK